MSVPVAYGTSIQQLSSIAENEGWARVTWSQPVSDTASDTFAGTSSFYTLGADARSTGMQACHEVS